jgi:hypothetical protein
MRRGNLWVAAILLGCGPVLAQTPPAARNTGPSENGPPFFFPVTPRMMNERRIPPSPQNIQAAFQARQRMPSDSAVPSFPLNPSTTATPNGPAPGPSGLDALQMPLVPRPEDTVWGNPQAENLVPFDNRLAEVTWADNGWRIVAGGVTLKEFGRRENEARDALRLIRDLRLNSYASIGSPTPIMEYWLSNGQAPQSILIPGLRVYPFDPANLRVEEAQGQWCLYDGQRVLFNFGTRADDARQALAVIRKYGFTEVGVVGQANPAMLLFLSRPGEAGVPTLPASHVRGSRATPMQNPSHNPAQANAKGKEGMNTLISPALPPLRPASKPPQGGWLSRDFFGRRPPSGATPGLNDLSERVPFDWRQAQVRREGNDWVLGVGGYVLANFGPNEQAARVALTATHYYRFTEYCTLGGPQGLHFAYFLSNGQAPRGPMLGLHGESFQPEKLEVKRLDKEWAIVAGKQPLFHFGDKQEEAKEALGVIQRNRFDSIYRIGATEDHGLTFLVRTR